MPSLTFGPNFYPQKPNSYVFTSSRSLLRPSLKLCILPGILVISYLYHLPWRLSSIFPNFFRIILNYLGVGRADLTPPFGKLRCWPQISPLKTLNRSTIFKCPENATKKGAFQCSWNSQILFLNMSRHGIRPGNNSSPTGSLDFWQRSYCKTREETLI